MPTPFYHLSVAEDILWTAVPVSPETHKFLLDQRPAFLFGNTAPDVQTVSGQAKEETHFFQLHIQPETQPAWDAVLEQYPLLVEPASLSSEQAAFIAGYLCHLQADWMWIEEIFFPLFGPFCHWQSFRRRLYLHNVLRAYLDLQIFPNLNHGIGEALSNADPQNWLPFVQDQDLLYWRDFLSKQLHPGAQVRTVEVFAARQGIPPEAYYQLLHSEERLEQEVFTHINNQQLEEYRQRLLEAHAGLLEEYLSKVLLG